MAEAGDTTSGCVDETYADIENVNEAAKHGIKLIGTATAGKETKKSIIFRTGLFAQKNGLFHGYHSHQCKKSPEICPRRC